MKFKDQWRVYLVYTFLALIVFGLVWRLVDLNLVNRFFLLQQSDARIVRTEVLPAHRGVITDRDGTVLAMSTPVYSVWANPKYFQANYTQLRSLSHLLQIPVWRIRARTNPKSGRGFVYLKRHNPPDVMSSIKKLKIAGVHFEMEYQRFYPEGEVAAHVLGVTNLDDQGQEGLELAYNGWLAGVPGKKEVLKDRLGNVIADVALLKKPQEGKDLTLSIDHRIQYVAYRALKGAVTKYHAKSGSVVVLDVKTGEILAMVNQPSYNPNNRAHTSSGDYRNRAITDSFEPGSTMKPFTIAMALQSGQYKPTSLVNTHPGYMNVGGYEIRDDFVDNGIIDLQKILEVSSNIGAAKILLSLKPQAFWALLRHFGFGQRTESNFPGESPGRLIEHSVWYKSDVATLAYGYGIAVTALQLAHAYAILGNHGKSVPVSFLKLDNQPIAKQVISSGVADEVVRMLQTVVTGKRGTGKRAKVSAYSVAGKTGTAYIAGPKGYNKKKYIGDFVGVAPVSNPRLAIAVIIRDPKGKHFGGLVAAPVFSKVMSASMRILGVAPDDLAVK